MDIINAVMPLLAVAIGSASSIAGIYFGGRWKNQQTLYANRSLRVAPLFAYINEVERHLMKVEFCIKANDDTSDVTHNLAEAVRKLSKEYDKSAVFFPQSLCNMIESILNSASLVTASVITGLYAHGEAVESAGVALKDVRKNKNELREVFQAMMGVKK